MKTWKKQVEIKQRVKKIEYTSARKVVEEKIAKEKEI